MKSKIDGCYFKVREPDEALFYQNPENPETYFVYFHDMVVIPRETPIEEVIDIFKKHNSTLESNNVCSECGQDL